ncbi:MAG: ComF family protein [Polaromonas sp.]|nr:ComF family protein [Polaromonas sp.]
MRSPGSSSQPLGWLSRLVSQCALCLSWPSEAVCQHCVARFNPTQRRCHQCALLLPADLSDGARTLPTVCWSCQRHPPPVTQTLAAMSYAFPWSGLIGQYKFGNQPGWAPFFSRLMLQHSSVNRCLADLSPADWVLPLPLSAQRLQARGFNQSWLLARQLARYSHTAARADAHLLQRIRDTRPQSQLLRGERLTNVKGAFLVDPFRAHQLAGRHVVLVDDVMTSGASIYTAAQALQNAGAAQVTALVLARTEL